MCIFLTTLNTQSLGAKTTLRAAYTALQVWKAIVIVVVGQHCAWGSHRTAKDD